MGIKKTQNFTLISNPLKSFEKITKKKVICKNVMGLCPYFTVTHVRQTCFAYNFFSGHFLQLFQRIRNRCEILRFLISF
jgi:hypothetical protein